MSIQSVDAFSHLLSRPLPIAQDKHRNSTSDSEWRVPVCTSIRLTYLSRGNSRFDFCLSDLIKTKLENEIWLSATNLLTSSKMQTKEEPRTSRLSASCLIDMPIPSCALRLSPYESKECERQQLTVTAAKTVLSMGFE